MVYTDDEGYDTLQIMYGIGSFSGDERLWEQCYPYRFLCKKIGTEGVMQPHQNQNRTMHRRIRHERSTDLASALIIPNDSLRRIEVDSCVSRGTINNIQRNNKFHDYRVNIQQSLAIC